MTWPQYRRRCVEINGCEVRLAPQEIKLFSLLFVNRGRRFTYRQLVEMFWPNPDDEIDWAVSQLQVCWHRICARLGPVIVSHRYLGVMIPLPETRSEMALAA